MKSDLPAGRVAGGIFIGNMIITGLVLASAMMLTAAVWIAVTS